MLAYAGIPANGITDKGADVLSRALGANWTLVQMGLSSNNIGDLGAKALADMLQVNSALETLYLEENDVVAEGEGASALRKVLLTTCAVKRISPDKQLAFMMGTHWRAGRNSLIHELDEGRECRLAALDGSQVVFSLGCDEGITARLAPHLALILNLALF